MAMQNIKLIMEYDGTRYRGWQSGKKDENHTLSGKISEVLRRMTEEEIILFCGEKTGAGVHASRQIVNFKTESRIPAEEIRKYLNRYLPLDIAVREAEVVSERFHAELNAHRITYRYCLRIGETEDVFLRRYVDFRKKVPDVEGMKKAAERFLGVQDFYAFSAGKTKKSTVRNLTALEISDPGINRENGLREIDILLEANGFLRQMPQRIIGTLLEIGYGTRNQDCIKRIFRGEEEAAPGCVNGALFAEVEMSE